MAAGVELANFGGRAQLVRAERTIDVAARSQGRFGPDPMQVLHAWDAFCEWAQDIEPREDDPALVADELGPPVPAPSQLFAIGLNYKDHALEASLPIPAEPVVFTKFQSALAGPCADIRLTSLRVDWEVELVIVMGRTARDIPAEHALDHVAGFTVGQDVSDRRRQFQDSPPQFSLGKSARGYAPIGPAVVALSGLANPNDLALRCSINGERMQDGRTGDMIFAVPEIIRYLSTWCELRPGDLIFTGTPAGVGSVRTPRRYLAPGDVIESEIEGVGQLRNRCRAP